MIGVTPLGDRTSPLRLRISAILIRGVPRKNEASAMWVLWCFNSRKTDSLRTTILTTIFTSKIRHPKATTWKGTRDNYLYLVCAAYSIDYPQRIDFHCEIESDHEILIPELLTRIAEKLQSHYENNGGQSLKVVSDMVIDVVRPEGEVTCIFGNLSYVEEVEL